jgi:hypothetical protein
MNRAFTSSLTLSLALICASLAHADDPGLLGCWRAQNMDQYGSDKKIRHLNSNCVFEIDSKRIRSECQLPSGRVNSVSTYRIAVPGRYVATIVEGNFPAAKEPPQPREIEYAIDGEWMTTTFTPPKGATGQPPAPDKVVGLAVRVDTSSGRDVCHPREPSKIRVGAGPVSSLLLTVPERFAPLLRDPMSDPELAKVIDSNFLIGQFVPTGSEMTPAGTPIPGRSFVLVVEDHKIGSRPMKATDFTQFKAAVKQEMGLTKVSCEDERKLCFDTPGSVETRVNSQRVATYLTTAFVNVKGRVVIIHATAAGGAAEASNAARRSAEAFAGQILRDNP